MGQSEIAGNSHSGKLTPPQSFKSFSFWNTSHFVNCSAWVAWNRMPTRSRETKDIILVTPKILKWGHHTAHLLLFVEKASGALASSLTSRKRRTREASQTNKETLSLLASFSNFTPLFLSSPESLVHTRNCYLPKECYKHDPVSRLALFVLFLVVLVLGSKMCPTYFGNKGGLRGNTSEAIRKGTKGPWSTPPSPQRHIEYAKGLYIIICHGPRIRADAGPLNPGMKQKKCPLISWFLVEWSGTEIEYDHRD